MNKPDELQKSNNIITQDKSGQKKGHPLPKAVKSLLPWVLSIFSLFTVVISAVTFTVFDVYHVFLENWVNAAGRPLVLTIISALLSWSIYLYIKKLKKDLEIDKEHGEVHRNLELKVLKAAVKYSRIFGIINIFFVILLFLIYANFTASFSAATDDYKEAYKVAVHEAGHCLVNEIEFPGTTKELRVFSSKNYNLVNIFIGREHVKYIPGGVHWSNKDFYTNKQQILKSIKVSFAGLVAEKIVSGEEGASTGADSDLSKIKNKVKTLVDNGLEIEPPTQWDLLTTEQQAKIFSQITAPLYEDTKKIILDNKDKIKILADELSKNKTISGNRAREIFKFN